MNAWIGASLLLTVLLLVALLILVQRRFFYYPRCLWTKSGLKVTIIHGEKDALIPISMAHRLSESVPDRTEFHSVPGASHHSVFGAARELIYAKLRQ
jgi:pimeloyl-ACP methyl ester carboxylesterase